MTAEEIVDAHVVEPIRDLLAQLRDAAVALETTGTRTAHEVAQADVDRITRTIITQYEDLEASVSKYIDGYLNATQYRADREVIKAKLEKALCENWGLKGQLDSMRSRDNEKVTEAWHEIADHPFFKECYDADDTLLNAMLAKLTRWHENSGCVNCALNVNVPRVIRADELREGQWVALVTAHSGMWEAALVKNNPHGDGVLLENAEGAYIVSRGDRFVLLEDAITPEPVPVTAEDIRNSDPGSTWDGPYSSTWEWDGRHVRLHDYDGTLSWGFNPDEFFTNGHTFTRSTVAPRGDYSKPEPAPELPTEPHSIILVTGVEGEELVIPVKAFRRDTSDPIWDLLGYLGDGTVWLTQDQITGWKPARVVVNDD